ncbi:MAG: transcriptional regulator domain-containing protein [Methylocella sp.]
MARADWRSANAYEHLRPLDAPAFAYEFLRRNPQFLADHARLTRNSRKRALEAAAVEEFSRHWGVRFQPNIEHYSARRGSVDAPRAPVSSDPDANPRPPR